MRLMWLCNAELGFVSEALGRPAAVNGGWMNGAAKSLLESSEVSLLAICYPQKLSPRVVRTYGEGWSSFGFQYRLEDRRASAQTIGTFEALIDEIQPDIIHLHGTEFPYCESMILAAESKGLLAKTRISIQGLVSIYASALLNGVPTRISRRRTLSELKNGTGLIKQARAYAERGEAERRAIALAGGIIGRTKWDRACCEQINPSLVYDHCGETLRDEFYVASPGCDVSSHAIFFSQGDKPIKGLHMLIRALSVVKTVFPDVKVVVSGSKGFRSDPLRGTSYGIWCRDLAQKLGVIDCFEFQGTLEARNLIEVMKSCACFVSASAMENSSNSLGEAMMLGLPCVSSYVGGMPSMAEAGHEVLFYPFAEPNMLADAILRLFGDPEMSIVLGASARERALVNHSPRQNLEDLLNIYYRAASK